MNIIHKLDPHVADLIAAGEVVERPASVVKELLENAIDAGATQLGAEIKNGGIDLIRVTDNGCGMSREDAERCFVRHATSKIRDAADLQAILTLGFRGEALAAICAVAEVELITRRREDEVGTRVMLSGGIIQTIEDAGCPVGTTFTIRKLFYNTPARMKFLKKNTTEANYCAAAVDRLALAHPEVAIRFIKDGRDAMRTPGDGKLRSAIYSVCGRNFSASVIELEQRMPESLSGPGITVWGYISKPELALTSRNSQYFILNGRVIRSKTMMAALEEAYRGSIMGGKYPGCVLQAAIDPAYVDVNVHPTKIEVKFADERSVFEAVYVAVKQALQGSSRPSFAPPQQLQAEEDAGEAPAPSSTLVDITAVSTPASIPEVVIPPDVIHTVQHPPEEKVFGAAVARAPSPFYAGSAQPNPLQELFARPRTLDISAEEFADTLAPPAPIPEPFPEEEPEPEPEETEFRIVGELFHAYIVVELPEEILYVDKHAAHERILYNQLTARKETPTSQLLLEPVVLPLSREDMEILEECQAALAAAGIDAEEFGGGNLIVREIPQYIEVTQTAELIADICTRIRQGEPDRFEDDILHSIACKAAIKAGWRTDPLEWEALVRQVLKMPDVRYCPHGRPVAIVTSKRDFEKGFRRIV